jgi:hypothetical protein
LGALIGCLRIGGGDIPSQSADGLLFEAVLQLLIADSLHAADIIPDRIEPGLWRDPISEAPAEVRGREAILARLALERT